MLFENLYKEADRVNAQRLLFAGLELGIIFSFCLFGFLLGKADEKPVVYHPPDSERLAFLDKTCSEIPKPEQFNFVERSSLIASFKIEVTYRYKTDRNFEEIAPSFAIWLSSNGWKNADTEGIPFYKELVFYKDKYKVVIENFDLPEYNYIIQCSEIE